jgi:hypothetical protein
MDSACNYTLEFKIWSEVSYSSYFTIVNLEKDGGIKAGAWCPIDHGVTKVSNGTCKYTWNFTQQQSPGLTKGATDLAAAEDNLSATLSLSSAPTSSSRPTNSSSSNGITSTTLALAVVLPVIFLLAIFAFTLLFGVRQKRWFLPAATRKRCQAETEELMEAPHTKGSVVISTEDGGVAQAEKPTEMDGIDQRVQYQADGTEIYQLMGDEEYTRRRN